MDPGRCYPEQGSLGKKGADAPEGVRPISASKEAGRVGRWHDGAASRFVVRTGGIEVV